MTRRFSSQELSFLRNRVPIDRVIENFLSLPTRNSTGKMSFCPVCHGFNTSINAKHNLARCFDCRQNFNPIELVMHHLQMSFVGSVKWLKQRHHESVAEKTTVRRNHNAQPAHIGAVLSRKLSSLSLETIPNSPLETITQRISDLERSVKQLYLIIEQLRSILGRR